MTFDWSLNLGSIVSLLLGLLVAQVLRTVRQIRDELRSLNGRMIAMETWRGEHKTQHDEQRAAALLGVHRE